MRRMWVFLLLMFLPLAAWAQTEPEEVELEEIVVTATRSPEPTKYLPFNVEVITEEDIKHSNAQTVADLLRNSVGVNVADWTFNRKWVTVDIRGFGETAPSNVLVLVDGRRVNAIDLSGVDWTQIPLEQIERIEILRGGGSVLYGDAAVGGVINIITKKGKGKPSLKIEMVGGSYDTKIAKVTSQGAGKWVNYSFHVRYDDTSGFRENGYFEGGDIGGSVEATLFAGAKIRINGNYHKDRYGMPGFLYENDLETWADRSDTKTPKDRGKTKDYFVSVTPSLDFGTWGKFSIDVTYRNRVSEGKWISWDSLFKYEIPSFSVTPKLVIEKKIGGAEGKFVTGFDYYLYDDADIKSYSSGALTSIFKAQRETFGGYAYLQVIKDVASFSFGYRYEELANKFRGEAGGIPFNYKKNEYIDTWEIGTTFLIGEKGKVYARVSKSYRYPLIDEYVSWGIFNETLQPQKGMTYELGGSYWIAQCLEMGITVFKMDLKNEIYYNPYTGTNENYDNKTKRWGTEISIQLDPIDRLKIWGNYTYLRATFDGGEYDGNDVPGVPNHRFNVGGTIELFKGIYLDIWGNYVGSRYLISDQSNVGPKLDEYFTINAKLSLKWKKFEGFIGVNNIIDEEYFEYGALYGEPAYYPAPGINVLAGIKAEF